VLKAITIIRPETLVRWHRAGFSPVLALEIAQSMRICGADPAYER
jgi:hypothetical protein